MKRLLVVFIFFMIFKMNAQIPTSEHLSLITDSVHLETPIELNDHLDKGERWDPISLITFSKFTGELLEHRSITRKELVQELEKTRFEKRYFVVMIGHLAIFYLG